MSVLDRFKANFVSSSTPQSHQDEHQRERVERARQVFSSYLTSQLALLRGTQENGPASQEKARWHAKPSAQHPHGIELPLRSDGEPVIVGHAADGKPLDSVWAASPEEMAVILREFVEEIRTGMHDAVLLPSHRREDAAHRSL